MLPVRSTYVTSFNQLIANGETITVHKVVISANFAATSVNLFERDGTTIIVNIKTLANGGLVGGMGQNFEMTIPFVAKNGLMVGSGPCTVWYSQGAA